MAESAKVAQEPATVSDMEAANMVQLPNDPTAHDRVVIDGHRVYA